MWVRRVTGTAAILLCAINPVAADSAENNLFQRLQDKVLVLRTPTTSKKVTFNGSGIPLTKIEPGNQDFDSALQVKRIRVKPKEIRIEGDRLLAYFDEDRKQVAFQRRGEGVSITIALNAENLELPNEVLAKVFLTASEAQQVLYQPIIDAFGSPSLLKIGPGIIPPKAVFKPEPEYSSDARGKRVTGTVLMQVVIGPDGRIRSIRIKKGVGYGLDEKAVAAVRSWRFEPALKDGKPVAVLVNVEVGFNLY